MNIALDISIGNMYNSAAQKARVITENWVYHNVYCPRCGNDRLKQLENNKPVSDFICPSCDNIFESKAKRGNFGKKIVDGAYNTMIERIHDFNNPDFLFVKYSIEEERVGDLFLIPKHFFIDRIIEKRKPLSDNAHRSGWIGCNILINEIPEDGLIHIIKNGVVIDVNDVCSKYKQTEFVADLPLTSRGWIMDIMNCINQLYKSIFTLEDMYQFEGQLSVLHPENNNIKPKIRQQLQILRNKNMLEFLGNGTYRKVKNDQL